MTTPIEQCPKCGQRISPEAPQGLCAACLASELALPTEAGGAPSSSTAPPTPERLRAAFPNLEIQRLAGQGGMGFVFKARQVKLERLVALKILPESLAAQPAFAERFAREGRLLARLNHPNIVAVYDFGEADGLFYLIMEYVDGVNLRQAIKSGWFSSAQALSIVPRICDALQFAHSEGILHRDIKPENILLDTKGRVKIADFGIAKLVSETAAEARLTQSGSPLGTPHYMAPEQIETPDKVDHRADIYSLGVVFYEMLTGELPLGCFSKPSEKSGSDPRLDQVILSTLAKERERRTQSVEEVRTQVETIATTSPIPPIVRSPAPTALEEGKPQSRTRVDSILRRPLPRLAAVLVLLLVLCAAFLLTFVTQFRAKVVSWRDGAAAKKLTLEGATNDLTAGNAPAPWVYVRSRSEVLPGESVVPLLEYPDGRLEEAITTFITHRRTGGHKTTLGLSWQFPGPSYWEASKLALAQIAPRGTILLQEGKPFLVFDVAPADGETSKLVKGTNADTGRFKGYIRYDRSRPGPTERSAVAHIRDVTDSGLVFFSATVPAGYALEAASNSQDFGDGEAITVLSRSSGRGEYHCHWILPRSFRDESLLPVATAQIKSTAQRGPIGFGDGEPCRLFSVTNRVGEVFWGSWELVSSKTPTDS